MESQAKQILSHLKSGKSLTAIQALKKFNCFRLAARIEELRDCYKITTEIISQDGKRFAKYSLCKDV